MKISVDTKKVQLNLTNEGIKAVVKTDEFGLDADVTWMELEQAYYVFHPAVPKKARGLVQADA